MIPINHPNPPSLTAQGGTTPQGTVTPGQPAFTASQITTAPTGPQSAQAAAVSATMFKRPIPGQSLTGQPGAAPWENPPQYTNVAKAAEYIFDQLSRHADKVALYLKAGGTAEAFARTVLFTGFCAGMWTVNLALLLSRIVLMQVVAIGARMGVMKQKFMNDRPQNQQAMARLASIIPHDDQDPDDDATSTQAQPVPSDDDNSTSPQMGGLLKGQ